MNYQRKLVSVKKIDNILPNEGADRIELAQFGGWKVIVPKGIHKIDENVIYFEIDSFIPFQNILNEYLTPLKERCNKSFNNIAIQGEIIGPKIQNNPHKVVKNQLKIFNIWDIDNQKYFTCEERYEILKNLNLFDKHVEITDSKYQLQKPSEYSNNLQEFIDKLLIEVNEKCGKKLEGFVLKSTDGIEIIKVISNEYL